MLRSREAEAARHELTDISNDIRDHSEFCWVKCPVCGIGPFGGICLYPEPPRSQK